MPGYDLTDTIVAPATALAASAIGLVRLSGPQAWVIGREVVAGLPARIETRQAYIGTVALGDIEDTAVALCWQAPHSYTGEDLCELLLHGNPLLLRAVIARCRQLGARHAEPGEFTYRAYVNGKLDLSQAEAVQEVISAGSTRALTLATAQLAGLPGRRIRGWIEQLQHLLASMEVIHDYAADDLDASLDPETLLTGDKLRSELTGLVEEMDAALAATERSAAQREGITVAICGPPNVGKSTLFNALLGCERALTAPEPGTTRDYLTESLEAAGVKLTLVDTAGYREATNSVEAAGVMRAAEWARSADRVLWVSAADADGANTLDGLAGSAALHVRTRCDLLPQWPGDDNGRIAVSGLTGQGIDALWQALLGMQQPTEPALAGLGARQAQAVESARNALRGAIAALDAGLPMDAAAVDLYAAQEQLHGTFEQADRARVIEQVFSGFCVGK